MGGYAASPGSTIFHGFLRTPDGAITTFDVPGSVGTIAYVINSSGMIAGTSGEQENPHWPHGFIRNTDGSYAEFDLPGTTEGTYPAGINRHGDVVGHSDFPKLSGFDRTDDGTLSGFSVPGDTVTQTLPEGVNNKGEIAGYYHFYENVGHHRRKSYSYGFIRMP